MSYLEEGVIHTLAGGVNNGGSLVKMDGMGSVSNTGRGFVKSAGQDVLLGRSLFLGGFGVFPGR